MSKRIRELANMAFEAGYLTKEANGNARLEEMAVAKRAKYVSYTSALEADITTALTSLKAALELVHHDADTPRLHRAIDMLEVSAAVMEGRDPSPWQELLDADEY